MSKQLTPKQVARAIGVSESSLKRWCDKGLLQIQRTAGGHRRLSAEAVAQFLRTTGQKLVRPELLGLPAQSGQPLPSGKAAEPLFEALESGDEEALRRIVLGLYLAGESLAELCDRLLAPAFAKIGHGWESGKVAVYQERHAVEICQRLLFELRSLIPAPPSAAPLAIGGTLADDPYKLATSMVELVLRDAGWQAESYGVGLPADTLVAAIEAVRPRLFWLSVSAFATRESFIEAFAPISAAATRSGAALVIGGRALAEEVRRDLLYSAYGDNLRHLLGFAHTLTPDAAALTATS